MNKQRRKSIEKVIEILREARDLIEGLQSDEETAFYNLSENLQMSERGLKMEEAAGNLEEALGTIDTVIECLEMAME